MLFLNQKYATDSFFLFFLTLHISDIQKDSSLNGIFCKLFYRGGCLGTKNAIHLHSVSGINCGLGYGKMEGAEKRGKASSLKNIKEG